jgi:hypothetical protein
MMKRSLSLFGAAFAGALFTLPAAAAFNSPTDDPSDRGVVTPHSTQDQIVYEERIPGGTSVMPEQRDPLNPNRIMPFVQDPEGVRPLVQVPPSVWPPEVQHYHAPPALVDPAAGTAMWDPSVGAYVYQVPFGAVWNPTIAAWVYPAPVGATAWDPATGTYVYPSLR